MMHPQWCIHDIYCKCIRPLPFPSEWLLKFSLIIIVHFSLVFPAVLYYFRNFFLLMLLALIQLFGMVGALKQNRNILTTFICCLMVSFVIMMIDYLTTDNGYLALGIFFLIQSLFAYLLIWLNQYRGRQISNIHYIPMPPDEELHGQRHSSFSSDSMRFWLFRTRKNCDKCDMHQLIDWINNCFNDD